MICDGKNIEMIACDGKNIVKSPSGVKICCDSRRIDHETGEKCPYLRLVDIGNVDCPVCVLEAEK